MTRFTHSLPRPALLFALSALTLSGCGEKQRQATAIPPAEVQTLTVTPETVTIYDDFVGTLEGSVNASIQARVQGYVASRDYQEGKVVKTGDVLFKIDARPFEAKLMEAKAALAQAEANRVQAENVAERAIRLTAERAVSAQEADNSKQQAIAAKATVEARKAAVAQAELDVEYTTIRSPIDGIAGLSKAQVGDLVGPSSGVLTTVTAVDPIRASFTVSDQRYVAYTHRWTNRDPKARLEHERQLEFQLILADGSIFPHKGSLLAADSDVDTRTGTQRIVTVFPNPGNLLRRGQFVRVRMRADERKDAIMVPQRSVSELQGTYQVAVVGADDKVELRPVKTGRRVGQRWLIEEGLKAGERIVVEGLQKARQGAVVKPLPWTSPPTASAEGNAH